MFYIQRKLFTVPRTTKLLMTSYMRDLFMISYMKNLFTTMDEGFVYDLICDKLKTNQMSSSWIESVEQTISNGHIMLPVIVCQRIGILSRAVERQL